jgi:hypothetical protein
MTQGRYVCDVCEKEAASLLKTRNGGTRATIECIQGDHDVERGRFFTVDAFEQTLKMGNWTEGSVWRRGIQFGVVCGEVGKPQRMAWT